MTLIVLVKLFSQNHPSQAQLFSATTADMTQRLSKKPELIEKLIPSWVSFWRFQTAVIIHTNIIACWLQEDHPGSWLSPSMYRLLSTKKTRVMYHSGSYRRPCRLYLWGYRQL